MADEADRSVVLALLQIASLGKCDDQGVSHSPVCQILLQIVVFPTCLDQFCRDVVNSG